MRIYKRFLGALTGVSAVLLVGGSVALALAQAGSGGDPLISKSYMEGTYRASITAQAAQAADAQLSSAQKAVEQTLAQAENTYSEEQIEQAIAKEVALALNGGLQLCSLASGSTVTANMGTELCMVSGSASLQSGVLVNLTTGKEIAAGAMLVRNQLYLAAESGAVVRVTSPVQFRLAGDYSQSEGTQSAYSAQYTAYADALGDLGLFSGSTAGYELERASTRAEGLVMLLRLLGEENQAKNYTGSHPFTDVPAWAEHYVAYAYNKGYTSGISDTAYGSQRNLTVNDYMTFLLRALSYQDSKGDFSWKTAADTAVSLGILSEGHAAQIVSRGVFYRDDIVYTSYQALWTSCKDTDVRLCDRLLRKGVFTGKQLEAVQNRMSVG